MCEKVIKILTYLVLIPSNLYKPQKPKLAENKGKYLRAFCLPLPFLL